MVFQRLASRSTADQRTACRGMADQRIACGMVLKAVCGLFQTMTWVNWPDGSILAG